MENDKTAGFDIENIGHHGLRIPDGLDPEKNSNEALVRDNADMDRLGKKQEFDRGYRLLSITAFTVVAMVGWIFVPNSTTSALIDGNTGGTIVMYLVNFAAFLFITLSLAEMASIAPTAGGQYRKHTGGQGPDCV